MSLPADEELLAACFRGERLYGDDFTPEQIDIWYRDEEEAYAKLVRERQERAAAGADGSRRTAPEADGLDDTVPVDGNRDGYVYAYHGLNEVHGFSKLPRDVRFARVLGFGSAYGDELRPILARIDSIVFVEPSTSFRGNEVGGVPAEWVAPDPSGRLPFEDATFDLITCLGVLHHVPNVSFVMSELARVLKPGAYALIREPTVSLGDWRRPRRGLTAHERGIPSRLFREMALGSGLKIVSDAPCVCPAAQRIWRLFGGGFTARSVRGARFDAIVSRLLAGLRPYHTTRGWRKAGPTSRYLVVRRAIH